MYKGSPSNYENPDVFKTPKPKAYRNPSSYENQNAFKTPSIFDAPSEHIPRMSPGLNKVSLGVKTVSVCIDFDIFPNLF